MKLNIDELEKKLIERYGKEKWEEKLNNFYSRYHNKSFKSARETYILGLNKYLAEAKPSTIIK